MDWVGPTGQCPKCARVIVLDEHGDMPGHWDLNTFVTDECPGAQVFNKHRHAPHETDGVPWWAVRMELRLLEKLDELVGQAGAAQRLETATRRAWDAVRVLGSSAADGGDQRDQ